MLRGMGNVVWQNFDDCFDLVPCERILLGREGGTERGGGGGGGDFGGYLIRKEQCYSLNKYFKKTNSRTGQIHRHASKLICKLTVQFGG